MEVGVLGLLGRSDILHFTIRITLPSRWRLFLTYLLLLEFDDENNTFGR